uniref:NADH dehydrogenase subunit 6 n=1 Tax=Buniapone amblyops TaxID=613574 RepID=UPI002A7EC183|nr:NADH dehydrogenase subunit 6 [Buniapone amblyops]WON66611.1 NADH dehydrogenase subunit 6 [Buniapone amblyops]
MSLCFMYLLIFFIISSKSIHPILLMIFMISYNLSICLYMSIWKMNYMYSILLLLITISGILIIYMYFTSLISNEQLIFKFNIKFIFLFLFNYMMLLNFLLLNNLFFFNSYFYFTGESNSINFMMLNKFYNILNPYMYPLNNFTIMTIFFMLLTFITISKINSSSHSFSMRKTKKL